MTTAVNVVVSIRDAEAVFNVTALEVELVAVPEGEFPVAVPLPPAAVDN